MDANGIRQRFLIFFTERGHAAVASSSLVPSDPSVLLTTAGMQQFKPYYTGAADPMRDFGSRSVASCQKSFRTSDIDEVGDERHLTFFEMLGNFSFGGYAKREAIIYAFDFITKEMGAPISYVTVFQGSAVVPRDDESADIWKELGVTDVRYEGMADVFWGPTGLSGPCGPTTEIYCKNGAGDAVEIWNIVFNQFFYDGSREELLAGKAGKELKPLAQFGVDTGMGLERLTMVAQKTNTVFDTDLFAPLIKLFPLNIEEIYRRIISDHIRAITFLLADSVRPGNKGAEYILRRLIRRVVLYERRLKLEENFLNNLIITVIKVYSGFYMELKQEENKIIEAFLQEQKKFKILLVDGLKQINELIQQKEKSPESKFAGRMREDFGSKHEDFINLISGEEAFKIYETYGIPPELISDELAQNGYGYHKEEFQKAFETAKKQHQKISRAGAEKKFGGHGLLLDTGELKAGNAEELQKVTRLHTATHLLQQALRDVLGNAVEQRGSDITPERTRFDFSFPRRVTAEELKRVEDIVNAKIRDDLSVAFVELPLAEAKKTGALYYFKEKYPETVKVYSIGASPSIGSGRAYSAEFCGGPHVTRTGEIGAFRIVKEEAVAQGIRRLRATVG